MRCTIDESKYSTLPFTAQTSAPVKNTIHFTLEELHLSLDNIHLNFMNTLAVYPGYTPLL